MGIYKGDQNQFGFFYESGTYASTSGALQWMGLVTNHEPDETLNKEALRYAGTDTRNVDKFVDLQEDFTGPITYHPQDWKFLLFALGSCVDAGSPSPYTHSITESNSNDGNDFTSGTKCPFISFGFEDFKTGPIDGQNFVRKGVGCMVNSMEINIENSNPIECTVDYIAQNYEYSSGAKSAITEPTTRPFIYADALLHIESGNTLDFNTVNISINNNLNPRHYGNGSKVIALPVPENRDYEITVDADMEQSTARQYYEQYFRGGSEFNVLVDISASTGSRDAFLTFSGCKLMDMEAPMPIEGVNPMTLTIQPKNMSAFINDEIEKYNPW